MKVFSTSFLRFGVAFGMAVICLGAVVAPRAKTPNGLAAPPDGPVLKGTAAFGDWHADRPGIMRLIIAADLPKPYASPSARNIPRIVTQPEGAWPQTLPGFKVERLATGLRNPRLIRTAPNGDIFIANSEANEILVMHGVGQGTEEITPQVFATGLDQPFGIALIRWARTHNTFILEIQARWCGFHTGTAT